MLLISGKGDTSSLWKQKHKQMTKNDKLFQLIKALSKSEKRYFSVQMSHSSRQQHLLKVFEAVSKQDSYDEEALLLAFEGERFVRQFHVTKNRLFKAILKVMRQYHSERSVPAEIRGLLEDVRFLYDRQLYEECQGLLGKAKEKAQAYEEDLLLLEILHWEDKLLVRSRYIGRSDADIRQIDAEVEAFSERHLNLRHFRSLESQLFYHYYQHLAHPEREKPRQAIEAIMQHPLLSAASAARSFKARCYFYNIHAQYQGLNKDINATYKVRRELLNFIQQKGPQTPDGLRNHIIALHNLSLVAMRTHRYAEALNSLQAMRKIPEQYPKLKASDSLQQRIFPKSYSTELALHSLRGNLKEGVAVARSIEKGLANLDYSMPKNFILHSYFVLAEFHFTAGDYEQAINWAEQLLDDKDAQALPMLFLESQALLLLAHWELGNMELQAYLQRALQYQLKKYEHYDEYWSAFFSGLKKVERQFQEKERQQCFAETAARLEEALDKKGEADFPRDIDLPNWCLAKAASKSFLQLKRTRAKKLEQR